MIIIVKHYEYFRGYNCTSLYTQSKSKRLKFLSCFLDFFFYFLTNIPYPGKTNKYQATLLQVPSDCCTGVYMLYYIRLKN